ncbi:MAG: PAS domain S-box protein [Verrucomicrobiota bacterium]
MGSTSGGAAGKVCGSVNRQSMNVRSYLQTRTKPTLILIALGLVGIVSGFNYLIDPRSVAIFYLIPVALAAWFVSKPAGISIAVVSAGFCFVEDWRWSEIALSLEVHIWNSLARFGFFFVVALLLSKLKALHVNLEQRVAERTAQLMEEITKRQALESELKVQAAVQESEERYRALFEQAGDAIVVFDPQTLDFVEFNEEAHRRLGYTREEFAKLRIPDFEVLENADAVRRRVKNIPTGTVLVFETQQRTKAGVVLDIAVRTRTIYVRQHALTQAIWTDITDRKNAAAKLEQLLQERTQALEISQQRLQKIYDSSQVAIIYAEITGQILECNHAFEAMTGYTIDELRKLTYYQLTPPEYHEMNRRTAEKIAQTGETVLFEREYFRKDGTRVPVLMNVWPVRDQDGQWNKLAAIIIDATEQRRLQREILEVSDSERRRIGQDLHDSLCQMLTGITFAVGSLEERLANDNLTAAKSAHEIGELLRRANSEARNIARGLYPVELACGSLPTALHRLVDEVNNTGKTRCELVCHADLELVDKTRALHLYRIVQEAVANALRHGVPTAITITLRRTVGEIHLEVVNNGRDWPDAPAQTGGIGLSIMAYRARMLGGQLQICRGELGGTLVAMNLPA